MTDPSERRRQRRDPAYGSVTLAFEDPLPRELSAELIDVSRNGFRCRHDCRSLETGQAVRFRHPLAEGEARVVWNRVLGQGIESGFFVL